MNPAALSGCDFICIPASRRGGDGGRDKTLCYIIFYFKINKAFKPSHIIHDNEIHITASIGISCYPIAGKNATTLIKNADIAMYQVKKSGCNNYQYFTKKLHEEHNQRFAIENALQHALEKNQFCLPARSTRCATGRSACPSRT